MDELDTLRSFSSTPPLPPTPIDQIKRRAERRRHVRWLAATLAVVVALVTGGIALAVSGEERGELRTADDQSDAARSLVLELAARSEQQGWASTPENPILHEVVEQLSTSTYVDTTNEGATVAAVFETSTRTERWWLTERRKREQGTARPSRPLNGAARAREEAQPDEIDIRTPVVEENHVLPPLPADGILGERTRTSQTFPDERSEGRLFEGLVEQLALVNADGRLRAGWLRMLAEVRGIRGVPSPVDRLGRTGVGVAFTSHERGETEFLLIFDPLTGTLWGKRETIISSESNLDIPLPWVRSDASYIVEPVSTAPAADVVR
jgi:hypothetical protein